MAYIARINAGAVKEIRPGTLADIPEADRAAWRAVSEPSERLRGPSLVVEDDAVRLEWPSAPTDPAFAAMELRAYTAEVRWKKAAGGLTLPNGVRVDTSNESKNKITQALLILERGWAPSIQFKAVTGWVDLDVAAMTGIAQAVAAHEQACFAAEKECLDAIAAGTVTSRADVDGWPWP